MTLPLVGCWILAAVAAARDLWRGRGVMPAPSLLSGLRIWFRYGVLLTTGVIFGAAFESLDNTWDFRIQLFSHDLAAYHDDVRTAVMLGFALGFIVVISFVNRLLEKFVPVDPPSTRVTAE